MEKEFVTYELAVKLKELGFDGFTRFHINRNNELNTISESPFSMFQYNMEPNEDDTDSLVAAPTFSQAFRWFREKYDMFSHLDKNAYSKYYYDIHNRGEIFFDEEYFNTPEEAELGCLEKLIEIVEQKEK